MSNPHFSPDGTKIAFTVSVPDRETNGYLSDLYLYDLGKKTVSRVTCSGDAKTWSWTAENTLIFTAARTAALKKEKENGTSFLYEISPSGGEAQCITSIPATVTGIRLLPDGRYLLTIRHDNYRDTRKKSYEVFDELPFWGNGQGYTNAKRNRYAIYDMGSGKLTYVADEWTDCSQYSVLGNLLLYKAYPVETECHGNPSGALSLLPLHRRDKNLDRAGFHAHRSCLPLRRKDCTHCGNG